MVALFESIPQGKGGSWRGLGKTLWFDVAHRLARKVPLTKLVKLDGDVCLYLAILIVAALALVQVETLSHARGHANYDDDKGGL